MVRTLMQTIFIVHDAEELMDNHSKQLDCIVSKFKLLHDLSTTLKVNIQDLLKYSSDDICGKITYMLILNGDTVSVIDYYVGFEFYLGFILPRAWFFLLANQKITYEKL